MRITVTAASFLRFRFTRIRVFTACKCDCECKYTHCFTRTLCEQHHGSISYVTVMIYGEQLLLP